MTGTYVDASSNNGTPNLRAYWADGHRELMLKATEGTGYAWGQMQALARQWHSFGPDARVGYYHWLYGTLSASAQYQWFWSHVGPVFRPGDWLMTDFEDVDPSRWVSDAVHLAVVSEFDRLCGQHGPVHDYAPDWYIANLPLCIAYFRARLNVASDYSNNPPGNRFGRTYVAHQFTDRATVPGFPGPVDYNRWLTVEAASGGTATQLGGFLMALTDQQQADAAHQIGVTDANAKLLVQLVEQVLNRTASAQAALAAQGSQLSTTADTLAALKLAVTALKSAPAGSIDPAVVQELHDAITGLPPAFGAYLKSHPLTLTGGPA